MKAQVAKHPARPPAAGAAHGLGSAVWLQGLACGTVVAMATPTAVLGALLMVPGIGALLLERRAGRPAARVTLLCGAAAAAAPLTALWQAGLGVGGALATASDPAVLAGCWAAQAAGWLLAQLAPVLLRLAFDARAAAIAAGLRKERAHYEAEWGIPPAAGP
jgi:hypothetical protein